MQMIAMTPIAVEKVFEIVRGMEYDCLLQVVTKAGIDLGHRPYIEHESDAKSGGYLVLGSADDTNFDSKIVVDIISIGTVEIVG